MRNNRLNRTAAPLVLCLLAVPALHAQPEQAWVRHYGGPLNENANAVVALADGGAAMAGFTTGPNGQDYLIVRYDAAGGILWSDTYDGPGGYNDRASDIGADADGNIYITGESWNGLRPEGTEWDVVTLKYSPGGQRLWERLYDGPGNWNDHPEAMVVDAAGNVHIASFSTGPANEWDQYFYEFVVLKYDTDGTLLWEGRMDGNLGLGAGARDVAIDPMGNVYATGQMHGGDRYNTNDNMLTAKWSPAGQLIYAEQYDSGGPLGSLDDATAITADAGGNAYVAGLIWLDGDGMEDYTTLKYGPTGELLWATTHQKNGSDIPTDIITDGAGNVYVSGGGNGQYDSDAITISYGPGGVQRWIDIYDEPGTYDFQGDTVLRLGQDGAIWGAMVTRLDGTEFDFGLTRYDPDGTIRSRQAFDLGSTSDLFFAFDLGAGDTAFLAGYSYLPDTASDAALLKLIGGAPCYADFTGDGVLDLFDFLAFVNAFNAGEDRADCDQEGGLDLFDFLCFTNAFNAGC